MPNHKTRRQTTHWLASYGSTIRVLNGAANTSPAIADSTNHWPSSKVVALAVCPAGAMTWFGNICAMVGDIPFEELRAIRYCAALS